jgi:hypothetical protein
MIACCSDVDCKGVTYSNLNTGGEWVYELRAEKTLYNSKSGETSLFRK